MGFKMDDSSVAVLGIVLVSTFSGAAIASLEGCLDNNKKKEEATAIVSVQPKQFFLEEAKYSHFVAPVYAIKPEKDKLVLNWRELGPKYI